MRTHNIPSYKNRKDIPIIPSDLALLSILTDLNYPCLELIFMVPKVFEPLKFDYRYNRSRPTMYAIFVRYLRHSTYEIDLSASFRLLICSEYQRNIILRLPNVDVKGQYFTIDANS